jgi:hypothetical protein
VSLNFQSNYVISRYDIEPSIIEHFPDKDSYGFNVAGVLIGPGAIKKPDNPCSTAMSERIGTDVLDFFAVFYMIS